MRASILFNISQVHKLEFYWGLEPRGLSTASNFKSTAILSAELTEALRTGDHALLPTLPALQALLEMHDWNYDNPFDRQELPHLEDDTHRYSLVSTGKMSTSTSTVTDLLLPIHPAHVLAASYHFFTNSDATFSTADSSGIDDRIRLVRELSSFYQLPLPFTIRALPEWAPREEEEEAGAEPRRRARRSLDSNPAPPKVHEEPEDVLPLLLGLPETLPKGTVDISSYLSSTASSSTSSLGLNTPDSSFAESEPSDVDTDKDLDAYTSEPCRAVGAVLKGGETWRKVYVRVYGSPVPVRGSPNPPTLHVTVRKARRQSPTKQPIFKC